MCRCWECAWGCRRWRWRTVQRCSTPHIQCTATCLASPTMGTRCSVAFRQASHTHHDRSARWYLPHMTVPRCAWLDVFPIGPYFKPSAAGPDFAVVRYHSLAVPTEGLPACLEPIAWAQGVLPAGAQPTESVNAAASKKLHTARSAVNPGSPEQHSHNGIATAAEAEPEVLMGLAHRDRPHYAVSIHHAIGSALQRHHFIDHLMIMNVSALICRRRP